MQIMPSIYCYVFLAIFCSEQIKDSFILQKSLNLSCGLLDQPWYAHKT